METKTTIEEKIKTLILEEIKASAIEACDNPTDDNISKLLNAMEYLKKGFVAAAPITTWAQSQPLLRGPMWYDNPIMATVEKTKANNNKANDDDDIFNNYL